MYPVLYLKQLLINGILHGIFGPVLDEIKIKELQEKNVLAEVSIKPIKFIHALKENFRKNNTDNELTDQFELAQAEYKNESMYLSSYEPTNKLITNIAKKIIEQHSNWNALILFDYTLSRRIIISIIRLE